MQSTLNVLTQTLNAAGQRFVVQKCAGGSSFLVLEHGARVLGLFGGHSAENFLWTSPALDSEDSARTLFLSDAWHNAGGDRTWLAPEIDFFFPSYPDLRRYVQQRALDPGAFTLTANDRGVNISTDMMVHHARSGERLQLHLSRSVTPAPNPLALHHASACVGLDYAGYRLDSTLEFLEGDRSSCSVGLWNLLQLPIGGQLFICTRGAAALKQYIGDPTELAPHIEERFTRVTMSATAVTKVGISARIATGRAGYFCRSHRDYALIVREFHVDPAAMYLDAPNKFPDAIGDAVQACVVNSNLGEFAELEYHSPAIGKQFGRTHCEDSSQVWAYRGSRTAVCRAARHLLAIEL